MESTPGETPGARAGAAVEVGGVIDGGVVPTRLVALDRHVEAAARGRFVRREIDDARNGLQQAQVVSTDQHKVRDLAVGDDAGTLAANGLDGSGLRVAETVSVTEPSWSDRAPVARMSILSVDFLSIN